MAILQRDSAQIFQFPARGRFAAAALVNDTARTDVIPPYVSYGSWYHDEAIEAERTRKN